MWFDGEIAKGVFASITDAWIETAMVKNYVKSMTFASITDAWIETA